MRPTPRQIEVEDLLDHATDQINDIIERVAGLFEEDEARTLFMLSLFGRFLKIPARQIAPQAGGSESEQLLVLTYLLASLLHGPEAVRDINPDRAIRRALAIQKKIVAAAGWSVR